MKIEKEKNSRIEIRLNEEDKLLLEYLSAKNGCSVSRYLRLCIDTLILPYKKMIKQGDLTYDNVKAFCDDFVQLGKILKK